jgi:hypothetical protein
MSPPKAQVDRAGGVLTIAHGDFSQPFKGAVRGASD